MHKVIFKGRVLCPITSYEQLKKKSFPKCDRKNCSLQVHFCRRLHCEAICMQLTVKRDVYKDFVLC